MAKENSPELLYIYPQAFPHGEAYLVGNRAGLEALKAVIGKALAGGKGTGGFWVADGEGYEVIMHFVEGGWGSPVWDKLALPYTDEMYAEHQDKALWPWRLKGNPKGCQE